MNIPTVSKHEKLMLGIIICCTVWLIGWKVGVITEQSVGVSKQSQREHVSPFYLTTLNGKVWSSASLKGKITVINLFATWCPPCRQELPGFEHLSDEYSHSNVHFIGISMSNVDMAVLKSFVKSEAIPYPIMLPGAEMPFNTQLLPTTYLIDSDGRIAGVYTGELSANELKRDISDLKRESS